MDNWYWIGVAGFLICMGAALGVEAYQQGQCRVEAIKVGKSAEDVEPVK